VAVSGSRRKIADHMFVQTEGAKLNKLVESSDAASPLPIASFVARQPNLENFLGPQVGRAERAALADTNLPEITEKRLLKPNDDAARTVIDNAVMMGILEHELRRVPRRS
jgi:hypothetical protein